MGKLVIETASTCCILSLEKGNVFVNYRLTTLLQVPSVIIWLLLNPKKPLKINKTPNQNYIFKNV